MQLSIENVGKIKSCTVDLDGITVIAGNNNTGKSTISRALFSIIESFRDLDAKIVEDRKNSVRSILQKVVRRPIMRRTLDQLLEDAYGDINESTGKRRIHDFLSRNIEFAKDIDQDKLLEITEMIMDSIDVTDREITKTILDRVFNYEFHGQINHINYEGKTAEIKIHDSYSCNSVIFVDSDCMEFTNETLSSVKAIYIDSPFAIDDIDRRYRMSSLRFNLSDGEVLFDALSRETEMESFVAEAINSRKLKTLLDRINDVVGGEYYDSDSGIQWKDKNLNAPLRLANLSSGLKMFAIIKRLLENGALQSGDFLIMDEPEIHLHPQWQIIFAEAKRRPHRHSSREE
jgi:predicted ATP-dependent endonuclease of OLD family